MALFNKFRPKGKLLPEQQNIKDIVENMNQLLNTKKGYGSMLRDYGIRDLNEFNDKEGMAQVIVREVIQCVDTYEPRIRIRQMVKEDNGNIFQLAFRIECEIRESRQTMKLVFDTVGNRFLVQPS